MFKVEDFFRTAEKGIPSGNIKVMVRSNTIGQKSAKV